MNDHDYESIDLVVRRAHALRDQAVAEMLANGWRSFRQALGWLASAAQHALHPVHVAHK